MAWFDLAPEGIVEVGFEAHFIGDKYGLEAVEVVSDADAEEYAAVQIAHTAGALAVSQAA